MTAKWGVPMSAMIVVVCETLLIDYFVMAIVFKKMCELMLKVGYSQYLPFECVADLNSTFLPPTVTIRSGGGR